MAGVRGHSRTGDVLRLIEIASTGRPAEITLRVGDVVRVGATGVRSVDPPAVVEVLGPLTTGSVLPDGDVIEAQGVPSRVLLVARAEGRVRVELVVGDPHGHSSTQPLTVHVAPSSAWT